MRSRVAAALFALLTVVSLCSAQSGDFRSALEREPEGWTTLLPKSGGELKGWVRVPIPPGGKLSASSPWSYDPDSGILTCAGDKSGHEWLRWDEEQKDGIFHIEWRFVPVEGKKGYNSGIYARNSLDGVIWHQAQTGDASGGFLFGESPKGEKRPMTRQPSNHTVGKVNPAGEWNTFEITCKGDTMSLWVNKAEVCRWEKLEVEKGYVGLEAEGYQIEFRNVKFKKL
jgi:hypothetical protein